MKIMGFDKLTKDLSEAQKALAAVDGELGRVQFDPEDPGSIEAAIVSMETMIDERVGRYAANPIVAPLIAQTKEHFRTAIIEKAARARLGETYE